MAYRRSFLARISFFRLTHGARNHRERESSTPRRSLLLSQRVSSPCWTLSNTREEPPAKLFFLACGSNETTRVSFHTFALFLINLFFFTISHSRFSLSLFFSFSRSFSLSFSFVFSVDFLKSSGCFKSQLISTCQAYDSMTYTSSFHSGMSPQRGVTMPSRFPQRNTAEISRNRPSHGPVERSTEKTRPRSFLSK